MIAESATGTTPRRLAGMLGALVASAAPFVAVGLLVRLRGPATYGVRDLRWPAVALLGWELAVVLLGGSYWLHYLMGLVPGLVLLAAAAAQRKLEAGPTLVLPYAAALVSTVAAVGYVVAVPIDRPEAPVIDYLQAEASPGDTAVVAFGGANILRETGMTSPYEHLWSLPVRVRDPELDRAHRGPGRRPGTDLGHRQRRLARHLGCRRERGGQGPAGQVPARRERRQVRDLPAGRVTGRLGRGGVPRGVRVALVVWSVVVGIPNDPLGILLWGWLALFIAAAARGVLARLASVRDLHGRLLVLPRARRRDLHRRPRSATRCRFDRWLGGCSATGARPPSSSRTPGAAFRASRAATRAGGTSLLNTVYASHFYVAVLLGLVLWVRTGRRGAPGCAATMTLLFVGLAGYVLVPTAPPWMGIGAARITSRAWGDLGLDRQNMILLGMANQVAAMPSLHTGIAALVAFWAISRLRSPWRWLLLLYPVAMGVALAYFGEHYVVDEIAGVLAAGAVMLGWSLYDRRASRVRSVRRSRSSQAEAA